MQTFISQTNPDLRDGGWKEYTREMVSTGVNRHLFVWPDIQSKDESKFWEQAIALGFTGLQTDHLAALVKFLKVKGLRFISQGNKRHLPGGL